MSTVWDVSGRPSFSSIFSRWFDIRERIIQVDRAVAEEWGRMNVPDPLPVIDGLLATTAKVTGLTLSPLATSATSSARASIFVDPFAG